MSKQKSAKRIKVGEDFFDIVEVSGAIGLRFTDQLSHIGVEFRRYKDGDKKCDRREGFFSAFPKDDLPLIIENLARLTLFDRAITGERFNKGNNDQDSRTQVWKTRIKNSRDRQELHSLLRLVVEVGEKEDLKPFMADLGRFIQKHEKSNPHLVEKFMAISDEMFPEVSLMAEKAEEKFMTDVIPQGHA